ncbi:hypothetical protein [Inquilinus limosus]|uniref:hypothetical protein n=1 Tax=Inquilinus limosus TaxID=171674 RepID=UPI0011982073|nr:hypothetical protein [Inquilinus limosus]
MMLAAGDWDGEIASAGTIHYGRTPKSEGSATTVELTYFVAGVVLSPRSAKRKYPGVLTIFAPTSTAKRNSAGSASDKGPAILINLLVSRPQFSDLARCAESGRLKAFHCTIAEMQDGYWEISSWGLITEFGK